MLGVMSPPAGGWSFVDVETTGLNPTWDRVVSLSIVSVDGSGRLEGELHSLVDPGRDPGPVHIHGLTAELLAGAPRFERLAGQVADLTRDRVLVAHNAQFDHKFLHAETARASVGLPTTHRLCTVTLSRRLDLPVENHKLATVAAYWGVPQLAAHDARDDVRVLREVFLHSQALATRLGVAMPVLSCSGRGAVVYPASITRVPSQYVNPRTWTPPARLVQGMKIVITGPTQRARHDLAQDMSRLGFDVMNSVSSQTRLVVCNEPGHTSVKIVKARALGVPVMTEAALLALLDDIEPGTPRGQASAPRSKPTATTSTSTTLSTTGAGAGLLPWAGRSVLIIGGTSAQAAEARTRAGELGARVLVNLGARTTHALVLDGGEQDKRIGKIREREIPLLAESDLQRTSTTMPTGLAAPSASAMTLNQTQPVTIDGPVVPASSASAAPTDSPGSAVLGRGHVIDLPGRTSRLGLAASWEGGGIAEHRSWEVDVVALVLTVDGKVERDEDLVFYNQPSTPDGSVRLTVDGDSEQGVDIDLEALADETVRVRIAAAIDGDVSFGSVGAIRLTLTDTDTGREVASATLDAATDERSLVLADVYRRHVTWRYRVVGQGYDDGLAELLTLHGIEVAD